MAPAVDDFGLQTLLEQLSLPTPPALTNSFCNPLVCPLDVPRLYLAELLATLIDGCEISIALKAIAQPADIYSGDFAVILPKLYGKGKGDWVTVGFELIQKFPVNPWFTLPFSEGVHLRFFLKVDTLYKFSIPYISQRGQSFGLPGQHETVDTFISREDEEGLQIPRGKIILEYSSPNIASRLATRHLRSTLIGIFLQNLYTSSGHEVYQLNYVGDWGKHLALLGIGVERDDTNLGTHNQPVANLEEAYARIIQEFEPEQAASRAARDNKTGEEAEIESKGLFKQRNDWFSALERGDLPQVQFFEHTRSLYVAHYIGMYSKLGVNFDSFAGESSIKPETMTEVEDILREKGLLDEVEGGSLIVDLKKHGKDKKVKSGVCIVRDRGGSSTYLLREVAGALERSRMFGANEIEKLIYVVEAGHGVHFGRVQVLLELMGFEDVAAKMQHIGFGEMSRRKESEGGTLLDAALATTKAGLQKTLDGEMDKAVVIKSMPSFDLDILASDTLLLHELSFRRSTEYAMDDPKATQFEDVSALNLLYWYRRLGLICHSGSNKAISRVASSTSETKLENEDQNNLLRLLVQYPDVTCHMFKSLESAPLLTYLATIASQVEVCLGTKEIKNVDSGEANREQVLDEGIALGKEEITSTLTAAEISLYGVAKVVLGNGLRLLGLRSVV